MPVLLLALFLAALTQAPDVEELTEYYDAGRPKVVREVRRDADGTAVNHGAYVLFHPHGGKAAEGRYVEGRRTGKWIFRFESGRRKEVGEYADDARSGRWKTYHEGGDLESEGDYVDGHRHGEWTFYGPDGKPDPRRATFFTWVDVDEDAAFLRGAGLTSNGVKTGPWVYRWPNGAVMAECSYAAGFLQGDLAFFGPDGSFTPDLISGTYRAGRRLAGLAVPPADREVNVEPLRFVFGGPNPTPLVDAWLDEATPDRDARRARLVDLGRETVPVVLERLVRCDMDTPSGRAEARLLHDLLADVCGGHGYPWSDEDSPAGEAVRRRAVQSWQIAWTALADIEDVWAFDFGPLGRLDAPRSPASVLFGLPLPRLLALPRQLPARNAEPGTARAASDAMEAVLPALANPGGRTARESEAGQALGPALRWLVTHQERDGHWDGAAHGGPACFDVGVTAEVISTLVGAGHTPTLGKYREELTRAVVWLLWQQDPDLGQIVTRKRDEEGRLRTGPEPIYEHLVATRALAEVVHHTDSPLLQRRLQSAVDHVLAVRGAEGRWEFTGHSLDGGPLTGDCSVTLSTVGPLTAAARAGAAIDPAVFDDLAAWLDAISDPTSGLARTPLATAPTAGTIRFSPDRVEDVTALALLARFALGQDPQRHPIMMAHAEHLERRPPQWDERDEAADMHRVHDGAYAMFLIGGPKWRTWNRALTPTLLAHQVTDGEDAGSWNPIGPFGRGGGRVLATALAARALEVYFRYRLP